MALVTEYVIPCTLIPKLDDTYNLTYTLGSNEKKKSSFQYVDNSCCNSEGEVTVSFAKRFLTGSQNCKVFGRRFSIRWILICQNILSRRKLNRKITGLVISDFRDVAMKDMKDTAGCWVVRIRANSTRHLTAKITHCLGCFCVYGNIVRLLRICYFFSTEYLLEGTKLKGRL